MVTQICQRHFQMVHGQYEQNVLQNRNPHRSGLLNEEKADIENRELLFYNKL